MEGKRKYMILGVVLIIYVVLMISLLYFFNGKKEETIYYVISPNTTLRYIDEKFESVNNILLENKNFNLYMNQEYIENYELRKFKNVWYYVEDTGANHRISDEFFATTNANLNVLSFEKEELNEDDILSIATILYDLNIVDEREMTFGEKVVLDIDNDQMQEIIYTVNYSYKKDGKQEKMNLLLLNDNEKISIIDQKKLDKNVVMYDCFRIINNIIDINPDQKYEIVSSCTYFDQIGTCHEIYQLKNGKYKKIYKCDEPK